MRDSVTTTGSVGYSWQRRTTAGQSVASMRSVSKVMVGQRNKGTLASASVDTRSPIAQGSRGIWNCP